MDKKEDVKVSLGLFTIFIIAGILIVVTLCGFIYLNHIANNNTLNKNIKNTINENRTIIGTENRINKENNEPVIIDVSNTYAFTCKSVQETSQGGVKNTLVAIDKYTGEETTIMNFNSGAYTYADGIIYFYDNTANAYHRFYKIDLSKGLEPELIYSFEHKYGFTEYLEYFENKLYYTFDSELLALNLSDNQIERISNVKNIIFKLNVNKGTIYFVNEKNELVELNLLNNAQKVLDTNSAIIEITDKKVIYVKLSEEDETWYYEYNLENDEKQSIVSSYRGEIGKSEFLIYNNGYVFLNAEGQLVYIDDESYKILTDDGNYSAITILPNSKILLERCYESDEMISYRSYVFNMITKQLSQTQDGFRYSYTKYMGK